MPSIKKELRESARRAKAQQKRQRKEQRRRAQNQLEIASASKEDLNVSVSNDRKE
jgi:hypothetical protein